MHACSSADHRPRSDENATPREGPRYHHALEVRRRSKSCANTASCANTVPTAQHSVSEAEHEVRNYPVGEGKVSPAYGQEDLG